MADPLVMTVDVWSDIACPWCYVGKARLDSAIRSFEASQATQKPVQISVKWHSYMIDIRTKVDGEDYLAYNQRRWGSDSWTKSLRRAGSKDGLAFRNWKWWPSTLKAHRLMHFAAGEGKEEKAKSILLRMTYEDGLNVSDSGVLQLAANELGLPNMQDFLAGDHLRQEVLQEDQEAKSIRKISGVPFFVVDNRFILKGAQEVDVLSGTFEKALAIHTKIHLPGEA